MGAQIEFTGMEDRVPPMSVRVDRVFWVVENIIPKTPSYVQVYRTGIALTGDITEAARFADRESAAQMAGFFTMNASGVPAANSADRRDDPLAPYRDGDERGYWRLVVREHGWM